MPDVEEYPWLPESQVFTWLKITENSPGAEAARLCRTSAASWVQTHRWDLVDTESGAFAATPAIVQAALLVVGRLYSRKDSPGGVVSFAEFGAASVLRSDPDVRRLLGRPRPRVG